MAQNDIKNLTKNAIVLGVMFLIAVAMVSAATLSAVKANIANQVGYTLNDTLLSNHSALSNWAETNFKGAGHIAHSMEFKKSFFDFLNDKDNLSKKENLKKILTIATEDQNHLGFYLVSSEDSTNLLSTWEVETGKTNFLLQEKNGKYLKSVFSGKEVLVKPIVLSSENSSDTTLAMFVGVPVVDSEGRVLSALFLRLNPEDTSSGIARLRENRTSGETYIFDNSGLMISNSRFDHQLIGAGILKPGEKSMLNVKILDPGGNIIKGHKYTGAENLGLTRMAKSATNGESGLDTTGYNDYRGVAVVGAWLWDKKLNLGIATEIDINEAFESYYQIRRILIFAFTASAILFTILTMVIVIKNNEAVKINKKLSTEVLERLGAETMLFETNERTRHILDSTTEGIYGISTSGLCTFANDSCAKLLGYDSPSELIGKNMHDLMHYKKSDGSDYPKEECPIYKAFVLGENTHSENEVFWRKDGTSFPAEVWSHTNNSSGLVKGAVVTFFDITEKLKSNEALSESEKRLKQAQAISFTGTWDWNIVTGDLYWTDEIYKIFGVEPQSFPANYEAFLNAIHPDDRQLVVESVNKAMTEGEKYDIEHRIITPDGEEKYVHESGEVYYNNRHESYRMIGVVRDITESKMAERLIRESKEMLQIILDNLPVGVFWKDRDINYLGCNKRFALDAGYHNPSELIGKSDYDMSWSKMAALYREDDRLVMDTALPKYNYEEPFTDETGEEQWLSTSKIPLKDSTGEVYGVLGVYENITERKNHEKELSKAKDEAEKANRLKSEFLASMSHELRTPMNAILGMATLLESTPLTHTQKEYIEGLVSSGKTLLEIISDILDISKIEAGKLVLDKVVFDPYRVIDDVSKIMANEAYSKNLEFYCNIKNTLPRALIGDPLRLKQVLINIVGNAIKFTEKGHIHLSVSPEYATGDELTVMFSINDTGIGIPEDKLETIFDKFSQADSSTTRKYGGTGLGLDIAKNIIDMMGGNIRIKSKEGEGSTFTFTSLFTISDPSTETLISNDLKGKKAFVLTPNKDFKLIISEHLYTMGMASSIATTPEEAETILMHERDFDLVMMDCPTDDSFGMETIQSIKESSPKAKIVLLTTPEKRKEFNEKTVGIKADNVFMKPLSMHSLYERLVSILKNEKETDFSAPKDTDLEMNKNKKVLLVEDDKISRLFATRVLESWGYSVETAVNGKEAIDAFEKNRPHVVLMDVSMPEMDGLDATKYIRQIEGTKGLVNQRVRTPVIALTAFTQAEDKELCLNSGMDDYLTKPIDKNKLLDLLKRHLGLHHEEVQSTSFNEKTKVSNEPSLSFDKEALFEKTDGDMQLIKEISEIFINESEKTMDDLDKAINKKDFSSMERLSHFMKGRLSAFGASNGAQMAEKLEKLARAKKIKETKKLYSTLLKAVNTLEGELSVFIKETDQ